MTKKDRATIVLRTLKTLYPNIHTHLHFSNPWELVVAVSLSARTTDAQVNKVTQKLFTKYQTLADYAQATAEDFAQDINTIGLYKSKAERVVAAAKRVQDVFGGIIPKTIAELITLPGVGRKTANVVLYHAFGIAEGIAVDTHVTRLSKKFGLTTHTDPIKIEQDLLPLFPKKDWGYITNAMISYGREHSPARKVADNTDPISLALKK